MSEAPYRVYMDPDIKFPNPDKIALPAMIYDYAAGAWVRSEWGGPDVEYVRADIAAAEVERLQEQVERLNRAVIAAEALADAVEALAEAKRLQELKGGHESDVRTQELFVAITLAAYRKATENEQ